MPNQENKTLNPFHQVPRLKQLGNILGGILLPLPVLLAIAKLLVVFLLAEGHTAHLEKQERDEGRADEAEGCRAGDAQAQGVPDGRGHEDPRGGCRDSGPQGGFTEVIGVTAYYRC